MFLLEARRRGRRLPHASRIFDRTLWGFIHFEAPGLMQTSSLYPCLNLCSYIYILMFLCLSLCLLSISVSILLSLCSYVYFAHAVLLSRINYPRNPLSSQKYCPSLGKQPKTIWQVGELSLPLHRFLRDDGKDPMTELSDIKATLQPELDRLNGIITATLQSDTELMNSIVEQYLRTKGKQLRPLLVLLSGRLFGGINERVLYAGAAIEMLHNASLIHDDVIDQATERRGVATISSVWSNHVAVLVGDFFVTGALRCAVRTGDSRILDTLAEMGGELSLGEINQYDNARTRDIDEDAYMTIISKKTASLFESCVAVGGYAQHAPEQALADLRRYARLMGICFQIKDDTFDYFDDPAVGKPTGNDLREGKITLPLIYALQRTDLAEHRQMRQLARKEQLTAVDIDCLVAFAKQAGGIDYAYATMQRLRTEAEAILAPYRPNDTIEAFRQIFAFIIQRKN